MNEYTFHFLRPPNYITDVTYYLPKYLKNSAIYSDIQRVLSIEHERYRLKIIELAKQFKPQTATFGLKDWQDELGINLNDEVDIEIRRSKVLAKLLGTATMTIENTNRLINLFTDDNSGYVRELPYPGTLQIVIPTAIVQLYDLRESLFEMMPAHLAIYFTFTTPDLIDEIIKTSDNHFLTIDNTFEEFIPFGGDVSRYSAISYPFKYQGLQEFNTDQLIISLSLNLSDRYERMITYAEFKAGDRFSEMMKLPQDHSKLIVDFNFKDFSEINDLNGKISLTQNKLYGMIRFSEFRYGSEVLTDDLDGSLFLNRRSLSDFIYNQSSYGEARYA